MPINTKRRFKKRFLYEYPTSQETANEQTLEDTWGYIHASHNAWLDRCAEERKEKARLVTLADDAIRAWGAEHDWLTLKAAQDPRDDERCPPEGVVTPSLLRAWIKDRSGVECNVTLDRGTFSVDPVVVQVGLSVRSVPE